MSSVLSFCRFSTDLPGFDPPLSRDLPGRPGRPTCSSTRTADGEASVVGGVLRLASPLLETTGGC